MWVEAMPFECHWNCSCHGPDSRGAHPYPMSMQNATNRREPMEGRGKLEDLDRSFDVAYWQAQGDCAIFAAAWELVVFAHRIKGLDERELELRRTVEAFQRLSN